MKRVFRCLTAALLVMAMATVASAQERPRIVAVNYALQHFAEQLVGDAAEVVFPVPEGVDPSFWRPSIADISMIQSADLILLNGAGFATWIDRVSLPRSRLVNTTKAVEDQFIVTESITHSHGEGEQHSHEGLASYTWLDPMLAIAQAEAIAAAVSRRNLARAADVETRLAALRADLEALDAKAASTLQGASDVAMITTHPRYQYFARRYGLSISALEWEAGAMPTEAELSDLKALTEETGARVLIWESTPPDAAIAAAQQLGLQSVTFAPLAQPNAEASYAAVFAQAVADMSQAAGTRPGN